MKEREGEFLSKTVFEVRSDVRIGILAAKTNWKLKRVLHQLKDLAELSTGQVIAFSLKGVKRKQNKVKGYVYWKEKGIWKETTVKMPDAIINRITLTRKWQQFFRELLGTRMINNFTFSKWKMYEWLSTDPTLSKHLPVTQKILTTKDIINFLEQYNEAIIKPINSSFGKGIYKITKQENEYLVEYNSKKQCNSLVFTSEELINYFNNKRINKKYIIQKLINLYIGNHPVDFRLIMVKNGYGEWEDVGLIARKGIKNGVISNSGNLKIGTFALQNLLLIPRFEAIKIRKRLTEISLSAVHYLEKQAGVDANIGNVGIDLAIDCAWNLWIIEINHRNPRHRMAMDAGFSGIYEYSNKLLIDYANLLAINRI
ncbi:YheC/YheD family endospore coat-associated protein [Alkalihalobacterium elongatum]|uniref:YheC/YheD family endospore coat-associated protein n=1 Tax=Alkalihalobacterium elongatum TaxID=2675466 RepID=UPI001C2001C6|nr:YheC/YheD family protein [Alkalihalobacterium elongatum]